jgi:hypothetical protein
VLLETNCKILTCSRSNMQDQESSTPRTPMPFAELIVVLFAILAIATPFITLVLLGKYKKLRENLDQLAEENSREHASFQREVADLKRQLAATVHPAPSAAAEPVPRAAVLVAPAVKETPVPAPHADLPTSIKLPAPRSFPVSEKKPEPQPVQVPQEPDHIAPPVPIIPASTPTQKPPMPPAPVEPTPVMPAAAKTPADVKPATPAAPPQTTPPFVPAPQPPAPRIPAPPPRAPAEIPPALAARVSVPAPISAYRVPTQKATFQQRMKTVSAIEEALGTNWLNKLGIIILVVGVALFGIYELGALGPLGKAGISYVVSAFLLVGGIYLEKNERYRLLGRTGIGGGWALLFFSTFGIYHVEAMRVLPFNAGALTLDCALMLIVAVGMALHTLRYRSQFVTGLAFLLGYTTVALSQDTVYSLSAGVILAIGLVSIVLKMGWFELEVFGILSSYLNHLYWLYRILHGVHGRYFEEYHASLALLFFYWITFRYSYVFRSVKTDLEEHISTVAAVLNVGLLLGCMKFQSVQPELAYIALLVVGAAEFLCAQIPAAKRRREAFVVLTVAGAALMLAAAPSHYTYKANDVAILWLVGAEVFLIAGAIVKEVVFRRIGLLTGLLVGLHLAGTDFRQLVTFRATSEDLALASGVLFAVCALVYYINFLVAGSRWKDFFEDSPDRPLLTVHSYLGAFAAASAAWALLAHDWTALAFAAIMLTIAALGRTVESPHVQVQYALLGALTVYRGIVVNLHLESPEHAHVRMRLLTLPLLGGAFYLTAKLAALRDDTEQRTFRGLFAAAGSVFFALLTWFEAPELWQPLAFIAFAVILSEAARALRYHVLAWHSHLLTGLAVFTALTAEQGGMHHWQTIPVRAFSALPVVAGGYWLAKRLGATDERHLALARVAYTWAGTGMMVWVLQEALRAPWIAVGWIVFAVVLALSTRWIRYQQLAWQSNVVGICALVRAYFYNYELKQEFWGPISLRIFTISLVAAGLYFLSRKAAPEQRYARAIAFLHSFAGTGLLALLAWYEEPNGWLAPLWATFALVLAIVDQRFELEELPWQSHILAGLTVLRSISVNLYVADLWHGISVRLLSLAIVAVIFYALSRLIRMPDEWRKRDIHHIYSWAASAIAGLLLWYELQTQPASIAVAWGAFGLVLFEYGLLRKITQYRYQAYVALIAAFTRIFFSNLTASEPGEFWGPRMYTILPLVLIFFFVYAQLPQNEEAASRDRRLHFDWILAYLGTATVVALFYFQFPDERTVVSWAAVVFALLGVALLLDRSLFLHQGLLLTVALLGRGLAHNLFGASYFTGDDWKGDYLLLSSAAAILLASLFFAFRLRGRYGTTQNSSTWMKRLAMIVGRPEQVVFFVPIILITLMLGLKMQSGMKTVAWGVEGVLIFLLALAVKERSFRLTGLGLLLLCVAKIMALDVWGLQPRDRYITLIIVGAALVFVSFLYTRYRDTIRQYL